jgi:hypothetical protein
MSRRALDWLVRLRRSEKESRAFTASVARQRTLDAEQRVRAAHDAQRAEADRLRGGRTEQAELEAAVTLRAGHVALASVWRGEQEERLRNKEGALERAQAAAVAASDAEERAREELERAHAAERAVEKRADGLNERERSAAERREEESRADTWVSRGAFRGDPTGGRGTV